VKPTIGFDPDVRVREPELGERQELLRDYTDAVAAAGGVSVILPLTADPAMVDELLDRIDGLVLTGGQDLDPSVYGATPHPETDPMYPSRQLFAIELARAALRRRLPILGICGGHQLVNVACGGDLIQHLPDDGPRGTAHRIGRDTTKHFVKIVPHTRLAHILRTNEIEVNSHHHQAIGRLGGGLIASARSADGTIEGVERTAEPFLICVQWHPERLAAKDERHLALFEALVNAASKEREAA
jgi:putative glutamine amidotransferase